jgi:MoxR-like ATPase
VSSLPLRFNPPDAFRTGDPVEGKTDSRTGDVYVFNDRIRLAVQVALATGRPLLVRGESGWGKSSLAAASARVLGWEFLETVITSRTQARDLQWELDLLLRLNDAQGHRADPDFRKYVRPGILWWAFQPLQALEQQSLFDAARGVDTTRKASDKPGTVVLIDEIDKADPDVPNNLLVALGSLEFRVEETGQVVRADKSRPPLVFITTNEERELPAAFLRRCIEIKLPALTVPDRDGSLQKKMLVDILLAHGLSGGTLALTRDYLEKAVNILIPTTASEQEAAIPSPAEFKDTILALVDRYGPTQIKEADVNEIAQLTLSKRRAARR